MAKLTLDDLSTIRNEQTVVARINANNQKIETALENTLSRDGTSPNTMSADLDVNGYFIRNHPDPVADVDLTNKGYVTDAIAEALSLESSIADTLIEIQNAVTAAEAAQTAAELAETNAETAEVNAETAEANAEAAQAAAEAAKVDAEQAVADATLLGGGVLELPAGVISAVYEHEIVGEDGNHVIGEFKNTVTNDTENGNVNVFIEQHEYGCAVTSNAAVDAYSSVTSYTGPLLDTALWLAEPVVTTTGYEAKVSYDRIKTPAVAGDTVDFTSGTLDIPSGVDTEFMPIIVMNGQSFATPIGVHAERVTTAAVDTGNALMPSFSTSNPSPYVGRRSFTGAFEDLIEGDGETVCSGFAAKLMALMDARGVKVPTVFATTGWGGTELFRLLQHNTGVADPDDPLYFRVPHWPEHTRTWNHLRHIAKNVEAKTPVAMPPIMVSEGYTETAAPVTSGNDYVYWLERWRDKINAFLRKEFQWHPSAPGMPCILSIPTRTSTNMYSGTTKILDFDTDGPTLGHWKAYKKSPGLIFAGADYHLTPYSDDTHPEPEGMYYLGEMLARAFFEVVWGRGYFPVAPLEITRDSATQITIQLQMMSGSAAIDTTVVTDFAGGDDIKKGFLLWRPDTDAIVPITNVAVSGTTVVLTIDTGYTDVECVLDYAVWRNLSTGVNFGNVAGARGNIKSSTAYTTTLSGGDSQYDWLIPFREKVPASAGYKSRIR